MQRYKTSKKPYQKNQQTIKYFDKFYKKTLQDNRFDEDDYESLCNK